MRLFYSLLEKDIFTAYFLLTIYFLFVIIRHNERGTWKEWFDNNVNPVNAVSRLCLYEVKAMWGRRVIQTISEELYFPFRGTSKRDAAQHYSVRVDHQGGEWSLGLWSEVDSPNRSTNLSLWVWPINSLVLSSTKPEPLTEGHSSLGGEQYSTLRRRQN